LESTAPCRWCGKSFKYHGMNTTPGRTTPPFGHPSGGGMVNSYRIGNQVISFTPDESGELHRKLLQSFKKGVPGVIRRKTSL